MEGSNAIKKMFAPGVVLLVNAPPKPTPSEISKIHRFFRNLWILLGYKW